MGNGAVVRPHDESAAPDQSSESRGRRMAVILAGAWRPSPPSVQMSAEVLEDVTLGLLRSKTGALGWWRVRHSPLGASAAGRQLRNAYYQHGVRVAVHASSLTRIVTRLRAGGVEPVLVKGPAVGRLYPDRALRPFEDLDLCVRPDQHDVASAIVADGVDELSHIDLHRGFTELHPCSWDEVYARSQLVTFGGIDVRILAAEDHLQFVCLHLLRHGVPSPLALCDVGAILESRPERFNWDRVLGADRRRADWVACTIGMAHQLLGAIVDGTPVADRAERLPRWLVPSVLEGWGKQCPVDYRPPELFPDVFGLLARAPETIRRYWPSPVAATVHLRRRFSNYPRMPIQIVDACARLARFSVRRLLGQRPDPDHV